MKNYKEFINEGYKIVPDDYSYFRRQILGSSEPNLELINDLIKNRNEYINMLIRVAKGHWELGDGKPNKFPRKEFLKVINEVIDEIINER